MTSRIPPTPRTVTGVNWIGLWTLYRKEVQRFLKVFTQTVAAPVVTTLLFYAVFALALGGVIERSGSVPFLQFLAPGLVMMSIVQNAFANTSSSVVIAKVQGTIVDILMPPFKHWELGLAWVMGGVSRGVLVGLVTAIVLALFVPVSIHQPVAIVFHAIMGSMMLALLGVIGGIWSEKFDHIAAVTNFVVTPLTFLSGTFYTIDRLPDNVQFVAHFNPFFYMIDGFRYGFIGHADSNLLVGAIAMIAINLILWAVLMSMLMRGYKLKS